MSDTQDKISVFIGEIISVYLENFHLRTRGTREGLGFETEVNSVFSALLARQTRLAIGLMESPQSWNPDIAPLFLRPMIECLLMIRWIRINPVARAKEYINYGLGSEKLLVHHYQEALKEEQDESSRAQIEQIAEFSLAWIEDQQFQQFVEVNLGSWTGQSIRQVALETDSEELYKFAYVPFSASLHNQWNHVGKFNAIQCENPLHKRHYVGCILETDYIVDFSFRCTKYMSLFIEEFDEFYEFESQLMPIAKAFDEAYERLTA